MKRIGEKVVAHNGKVTEADARQRVPHSMHRSGWD